MPRAKASKRKHSTSPERATSSAAANQAKKLKLLEAHSVASPFPDFNRPTPEEAQEVYDVAYNVLCAAVVRGEPATYAFL